MAFKRADEYRKDKYGQMLVLPNDGDFVDVVLLYQSQADLLLADVHYIKSDEYDGYVHCNGKGCVACNHVTPKGYKGIRIQPKLFIPMYNVMTNEVIFFDRSIRFEDQLQREVFRNYPNPSDYVFRLTRHGAANSIDTYYSFVVVGNNTVKSFDAICKEFNLSFPQAYETAVREVDNFTLQSWLNSYNANNNAPAAGAVTDYSITPRAASAYVVPEVGIASADSLDYIEDDEDSIDSDLDAPSF